MTATDMSAPVHSPEQLQYLKAMGITAWELRAPASHAQESVATEPTVSGDPADTHAEAPTPAGDRLPSSVTPSSATPGVALQAPAVTPNNPTAEQPKSTPETTPEPTPERTEQPLSTALPLNILQDPAHATVMVVTLSNSQSGARSKLLTAMLNAIELPLKNCMVVELGEVTQLASDAFSTLLATRTVTAVLALVIDSAAEIHEAPNEHWSNARGDAVLDVRGFHLQHLLDVPTDKRVAWNQLKNLRTHLSALSPR